jgi:hypothetical protein
MKFTKRVYREAFRSQHRKALEALYNQHGWTFHHRTSWLIFQRARRKGFRL